MKGSERNMRIYVEGQDGAAKTPFCLELVEELRGRGHDSLYWAPFTRVNQALKNDVYHLWRTDHRLAAALILQEIQHAHAEIVIFDRGALTVERGLDEVPHLSHNERAEILAQFPEGKHVFLDTSLERAMSGKRYMTAPPPWSLSEDQRRRLEIAAKYSFAFRAVIGRDEDLKLLAGLCADALAL